MLGAFIVASILVIGLLGYVFLFQGDDVPTLVVYTNEPAVSLDPAVATDRGSAVPITNIYETLVRYQDDDATSPEAWLATSWSVSSDRTWYNFSLRQGVTFSNGNPFTADDVRFTLERVAAIQGLDGAESRIIADYVDLDNLAVADDYTVSIKLLKPHAGFIAVFAKSAPMGILDKEYSLKHYSPSDLYAMSYLRDHSMGTGPYALDEWNEGSSMTLTRNQDYWRSWDGDHFEKVVLKENRDVEIRMEAIRDGRADLIELPPNTRDDPDAFPGLGIKHTRGFQIDVVVFNTETLSSNHAFMKDSVVRQAFCHAFNYDNLSAELYNGHIEEMQGVIPNGFPFETVAQPSKVFRYNLSLASQLLNQSGYPLGEDGLRFEGDYVDFLVNKSDRVTLYIASAYKEDLGRLGIVVNLRNASESYIYTTRYWDMCIRSYVPDCIDPEVPVRALAVSQGRGGDVYNTGIDILEVDLAAESALTASTEEGRAENYSAVWSGHSSDPNMILIGQVMQVCVYSLMLDDFTVNPVNLYSFYDFSQYK